MYELQQKNIFFHPFKDYFLLFFMHAIVPIKYLLSPFFNFITGLLTKFSIFLVSIILFRQFIKNDIVVLITLILLTLGLYVEGQFHVTAKYATHYSFRQMAGVPVLLCLLCVVKKRWLLCGIILGLTFFVHAKIGFCISAVLVPSILLYNFAQYRDARKTLLIAIQLTVPLAIITYIYLRSTFAGSYIAANANNFPTYQYAFKLEPDDFFFTYLYLADMTPQVFQAFSPKKFSLLVMGLFVLATMYFSASKEKSEDTTPLELFLVLNVLGILLYLARISPEICLYLGVLNILTYWRYAHLFGRQKDSLLVNPVSITTLIITSIFVISALTEKYYAVMPFLFTYNALPRLFLLLYLNTFISVIIFGVLLSSYVSIHQERFGLGLLSNNSVKTSIILVLALGVCLSYLFPIRKETGDLLHGADIYRTAFNYSNEAKPSLALPEPYVYRESLIDTALSYEQFSRLSTELIKINNWIREGSLAQADLALQDFPQLGDEYVSQLYKNSLANFYLAKGELKNAYSLYSEVQQEQGNWLYPIFQNTGSQQVTIPTHIPSNSYKEVIAWFKTHTDADVSVLNPPYLDYFTESSKRNAFFPDMHRSVEVIAFNAEYADIYFSRQKDVLGLTFFDLPGFVLGDLSRPELRRRYLTIGVTALAKIVEKYPTIDYLLTEASHILPLSVAYKNEYFVVYFVQQ